MDLPGLNPSNEWVTRVDVEARRKRTAGIVRRSTLIVPAHVRRYIEKARDTGADAVQLDLEDGVPFAEKDTARKGLRESICFLSRPGVDVLVRINNPFIMAVEDLDSCIWPGITGVVFSKAESPSQIQILDKLIEEREMERGIPAGSVQIGVLVETPVGLARALNIALSSVRVTTINLGTEDFARETGIDPFDVEPLLFAKSQIVLVANLAGIQPLGLLGSISDFRDLDRLTDSAKASRRAGFKGASCIHPSQVQVLNIAFSPDPSEVAWAEKAYRTFQEAVAQGHGAAGVDGRMVDEPVAARALSILARAAAIRKKEAEKAKVIREE